MTLNEYMEATSETAKYPSDAGILYCTIALCGESGELANTLKKVIRDDQGPLSEQRLDALKAELGDVLWYAARLSYELGTTLEDIAQANLNKLRSRKERNVISGDGDNR